MDGIRTETGLEFVVAAILILLSLIAAVASLTRRGGFNRQDAEDLLNDASARQASELEQTKHAMQQLQDKLEQAIMFQDEKLGAGINELQSSLNSSFSAIQAGMERAAIELKSSITELAKQQNEAKAQSAIQMCDALISSLGSVRNSIAAQIAEPRSAELLQEEQSSHVTQEPIPPPLSPQRMPPELPKEETNQPDTNSAQ